MHFYELHEGDGDVFSDVLLASEDEYSAEDFLDLVQGIRLRIQDHFEQDTLIESIAAELEREHDFIFISDDRLTAALNVSRIEEDNFIAEIDEGGSIDRDGSFRTLYADLDPTGAGESQN